MALKLVAFPLKMCTNWQISAETAHYTVPDWQCLHSGLGHGVRAQQDVLEAAHSASCAVCLINPYQRGSVNGN